MYFLFNEEKSYTYQKSGVSKIEFYIKAMAILMVRKELFFIFYPILSYHDG